MLLIPHDTQSINIIPWKFQTRQKQEDSEAGRSELSGTLEP